MSPNVFHKATCILLSILLLTPMLAGCSQSFATEEEMQLYLNGAWENNQFQNQLLILVSDGRVLETTRSLLEGEIRSDEKPYADFDDFFRQLDWKEPTYQIKNGTLRFDIHSIKIKGENKIKVDDNLIYTKVDDDAKNYLTKNFNIVPSSPTSPSTPVKPEKSIVVSTEEYYERLKYYFPEIEEWVLIDEKENNRTYSTNGETENIKGLLSISDKSLIMTNYHGSFVVNYTIESNTKASIMIQEKKLGISEQWLFNLAGYILEYTGKKNDAATLISDSKAHAVVENGVENYTAVIHGVQYTVLRKTDKSNLTIMISFGGDYE